MMSIKYSKTVNIPYFWHVSRLGRTDRLRTVDDYYITKNRHGSSTDKDIFCLACSCANL